MKKIISLISIFLIALSMLSAAAGDPLKPGSDVSETSQVSDTLKIILEPTAAENQHIWVGFTSSKVESSNEDAENKTFQNDEFTLSMGTTEETKATASNGVDTLFISAQFAYSGYAHIKLSGKALSGANTSGGTDYIGYTITHQNKNTLYLDVDASDKGNIVTDDVPNYAISHQPTDPASWVNVYSEPLKITTDTIGSDITATSFEAEITATVISGD